MISLSECSNYICSSPPFECDVYNTIGLAFIIVIGLGIFGFLLKKLGWFGNKSKKVKH